MSVSFSRTFFLATNDRHHIRGIDGSVLLKDADSVASFALCGHQSGVGRTEQGFFCFDIRRGIHGNADRHCDPAGLPGFPGEALPADFPPDSVSDGHRAGQMGGWQNDQELFSAVACDNIDFAHTSSDSIRHAAKDGVAVSLPSFFIMIVKLIDIDDHTRQRFMEIGRAHV